MKIQLLGAAREVTGSCIMIEACGLRFGIDCGLHQGGVEKDNRNNDVAIYDPAKIDFFVITHAHIDHSGLLPRMVKNGFDGPIYTTPPTRDLLEIMLMDSAHIQEMEAQWRNVKRQRYGEPPVEPLYTQQDAVRTHAMIRPVPYQKEFKPAPGITFLFQDAGHILGASIVELIVEEKGNVTKTVFSGDIGRPAQLLVRDPSVVSTADYLFLESTYGERNHRNESDSLDELAEAVNYSYSRGEKVIIPAFAIARTQEMIYSLYQLDQEGRLPADMPIFVDSPLAIKATEVFRRHRDYYDEHAQAVLKTGDDPLKLKQLRFTLTREESAKINNTKGPAIVISANGMANAGRIKHHLRHNIWRNGASIVFVGFQARGTVGRKIVDGAKKINIMGEELVIKARIYTINGFSGHAGQSQLLDWIGNFNNPRMQIFLFHGEYSGQQVLAELIRNRFDLKVHIPDYLEEFSLEAGEVAVKISEETFPMADDWDRIIEELNQELMKIRAGKNAIESMVAREQMELKELLGEAKNRLSFAVDRLR